MISEVKEQYAVPVYNFENFQQVRDDDISFTINDQLFFETLLMEIRGKTISFATHLKKEETLKEKELENRLRILEEEVTDADLPQIDIIRNELEEIRKKKAEGIAVRSRVRWLQEGEKVSAYFCNLESRNYKSKAMAFLEKDNGDILMNQNEILQEVKEFYEALYSRKEVRDVNLSNMLPQDTPVLSEEAKFSLEGPLTLQEIKLALQNMQNNKSPGTDGFTVEFFKFCFTKT